MTKNVQEVQRLIGLALKRGEAKDSKYAVKMQGDWINLYHYGTLILKADVIGKNIIQLGGYSSSDQNAISTALQTLGFGSLWVSKSKSNEKKAIAKLDGWYILK